MMLKAEERKKKKKEKKSKSNFIKIRKLVSVPEGLKEKTLRNTHRKARVSWAVLTLMVWHQWSIYYVQYRRLECWLVLCQLDTS